MTLASGNSLWDCAPQDPEDKCILYTLYQSGTTYTPVCEKCKPGFAYEKNTQSCVQINIPGCTEANIYSGEASCYSCINASTSEYGDSCIPFENPLTPSQKTCLYGGPLYSWGTYCHYCREGYNFGSGKCTVNSSAVTGCSMISSLGGDRCIHCDTVNGWYSLDYVTHEAWEWEHKCTKL